MLVLVLLILLLLILILLLLILLLLLFLLLLFLLLLLQLFQRKFKIDLGIQILRIKAQRLFVRLGRAFVVLGLEERVAQVVVALLGQRFIGIQHGDLQGSRHLIVVFLSIERIGHVVERRRQLRIGGRCLLILLDGGLVVVFSVCFVARLVQFLSAGPTGGQGQTGEYRTISAFFMLQIPFRPSSHCGAAPSCGGSHGPG